MSLTYGPTEARKQLSSELSSSGANHTFYGAKSVWDFKMETDHLSYISISFRHKNHAAFSVCLGADFIKSDGTGVIQAIKFRKMQFTSANLTKKNLVYG